MVNYMVSVDGSENSNAAFYAALDTIKLKNINLPQQNDNITSTTASCCTSSPADILHIIYVADDLQIYPLAHVPARVFVDAQAETKRLGR